MNIPEQRAEPPVIPVDPVTQAKRLQDKREAERRRLLYYMKLRRGQIMDCAPSDPAKKQRLRRELDELLDRFTEISKL